MNNRYRVIRVLGSGGFGETFLAEDTQMPSGRKCVIKQLKPVADNPQIYQLVQERFQREAAILEELGGSNQIPTLYAYFVEGQQFYLVQEYVEGQTLTQKLQQPLLLSESSVKEFLSSILPVLDYVHSKGIVHRDIKPDNILIRTYDNKPVLIDFGAVKETMGTVMAASGDYSMSIVAGTPGFMASEQSLGRPVFASDFYSLGLTAIYLLTGKIPQQLQTNPGTGGFVWRHYALSISPSFANVLDKAIAYHPRDRYSTSREMLEALQTSANPIIPIIPKTTEISPPAPGDIQHPTVISPKPAGVEMSDWQKAVIMGGVIGTFIVGGLWLIKPSITQSEVKSAVPDSSTSTKSPDSNLPIVQRESKPVETKTITSPKSVEPTSPIFPNKRQQPETTVSTSNSDSQNSNKNTTSITRQAASDVIDRWLQAKRVMFAPPYDSQPAAELTTGEQYEKTAGTEGSINALKKDGQYYKYGVQKIDGIDNFSASGERAAIQVKVTEDRTLFNPNGKIDSKQTDFKTRTVRYNLQFVDGQWKIADNQIISN